MIKRVSSNLVTCRFHFKNNFREPPCCFGNSESSNLYGFFGKKIQDQRCPLCYTFTKRCPTPNVCFHVYSKDNLKLSHHYVLVSFMKIVKNYIYQFSSAFSNNYQTQQIKYLKICLAPVTHTLLYSMIFYWSRKLNQVILLIKNQVNII